MQADKEIELLSKLNQITNATGDVIQLTINEGIPPAGDKRQAMIEQLEQIEGAANLLRETIESLGNLESTLWPHASSRSGPK